MDDRREFVVVDLSGVSTSDGLHKKLAHALEFPDFYGRNWAAFWDAITGLVQMPHRLRLAGWQSFAARLPKEAESMKGCLEDMTQLFPNWAPVVEYD